MALDLSKAAAFQAIRAKEKAHFEASEQEAAEAARAGTAGAQLRGGGQELRCAPCIVYLRATC
jgi:hypothetical protein